MRNIRVISRLDIKGSNLIKGIQLEGLRVLGKPNVFAKKYYFDGIDEILYMDSVASLYGRNNLDHIVKETTKEIFVPITVGGGIRTLDDAYKMFKNGADKVAVNSAIIKNKNFLNELVNEYGSQSIVVSIEAKKKNNSWEVYFDNGREPTNINVFSWVEECQDRGAGEILITSVDNDGTKKGFDFNLYNTLPKINIPLIISGGFGGIHDLEIINKLDYVDAISIGTAFHYNLIKPQDITSHLYKEKLYSRLYDVKKNINFHTN